MVISEKKLRSIIRQCIREMKEEYPPIEEYPEGIDDLFADMDEREKEFYQSYMDDLNADLALSFQEEDENY